jgi:hypothetical protein
MGDRDRQPPQPPPDIGGLISLKVDNIPFTMTKIQLQEIYAQHGDVSHARAQTVLAHAKPPQSFLLLDGLWIVRA